ncbi:MAG: tRNA-dihydrouridine synthase family protein [Planctomycetes bacterium]|nr:tRNA-dihydrouridine synthase family protein [Planctomycetota bacterium]
MLSIGSVQLDVPIVQAALAGYSDAAMRLIARRHGAPYALTEVLLDKLIVEPGKIRRRALAFAEEDRPLGGQLMGSAPQQFAEAAVQMVASGFDVVDLNFACPVRKVLGRCRGGYLLSDPPPAIDILRRVRGALPPDFPVTLKMRRGMDDSAASVRHFFRIIDAAFELGLAAVTVHGRTVRQRYIGPSDWSFLRRVKQHVGDRIILGSGDLFSAEDVVRMLAETGVDGVTLARGCIGNPWIFRDARALLTGQPLPAPPTVAEQGRVIRTHYELSVAAHGENRAPRLMRKFGIKYSELHPYSGRVREAFVASRDRNDWLRVLAEWYDPQRDWPPPRRKTAPGDLVAAGAKE